MPGYSKPEQPYSIPLTAVAAITANATLRGPLMKHPGTIIGADISSASNHIADDETNYVAIDVRSNGNVAWSLNTGVTNVNAQTVTFPTQSTTAANSHFVAGEELTVLFTVSDANAVDFPIGTMVWVHVSKTPDYNTGG